MPGNHPSELEPYEPIWKKATTPAPPQPSIPKKQREAENRFPSARVEPPSLLYPGEGRY